MARAKEAPENKRSHAIRVLVTPRELARLRAAAAASRISSLSQWSASILLQRADELGIPEADADADPPKKKPRSKK